MINVRLARRNEVTDLQKLNNEVFIDNTIYDDDLDPNWAMSNKGFTYFTSLLNDPQSLCLIVEDGEKKIGYLAAGPKEIDYRLGKYAEVQNMGVIPEYRSHGIGKQLLCRCFDWARNQGFSKVFVCSYAKNKRAIEFYRSSGFEEIDISLEKDL